MFVEFILWVASLMIFSFGIGWAFWWARRAAWVMWTFMPRLRNTALRNIDMCLPELSETERTRIARKSFNHVLYAFFEFVLIPRHLGGDKWKKYVTLDDSMAPYFGFVREGKAPLTAAGTTRADSLGAVSHSASPTAADAMPMPPTTVAVVA
jgi:hypothetical protein